VGRFMSVSSSFLWRMWPATFSFYSSL
jgi:hypothetical protein